MKNLFYKSIGFLLLVFLLLGITYSKKENITQKKLESNILAKCKKVYEDLFFLDIQLKRWAMNFDFMPFPDWLVNASYEQQKKHGLVDFLEVEMHNSPFYSRFTTYPDKLNYFKQENNNFYLLNHYKLLLNQSSFTYTDLSTRTIDPFSPTNSQYQYHQTGLPEVLYFWIIISNGPDQDTDINVKDMISQPPTYGLDKHIIEYAYDPTNGIISNGDIFWISLFYEPYKNLDVWQAKRYEQFTGRKWPTGKEWKKLFYPDNHI